MAAVDLGVLALGALGLLFVSRKGVAYVSPSSSSAAAEQERALSQAQMIWSPPAAAAPYLKWFQAAEAVYDLPPGLLARVAQQESSYRANARSKAGALGLMQFMPATAAELGIDPLDPRSSIYGAALYLRQLYARFGTWRLALAAYNWGQGNLSRLGIAAAPAETSLYVAAIAGDLKL